MRSFVHAGARAAVIALFATSVVGQSTVPQGSEEQASSLMRGEPYTGPTQPTPRGLDGKPDFTGFWRPLKEAGKPGGNLGKDEPDFILPFNETGKRAPLHTQNHTVDPEALCILGGIPRHNGSGLPFEVLHTPKRIAFTYHYNTSRRISIGSNLRIDPNAPPKYFAARARGRSGRTVIAASAIPTPFPPFRRALTPTRRTETRAACAFYNHFDT